jgi:hypothetical protein
LRIALGLTLALLPLLAGTLLVWRVRRDGEPSARIAFVSAAIGVGLGAAAVWIERAVLGLAQLADAPGPTPALIATLLFVAPLEEGLKVAAVWPLYTTRRLTTPAAGALWALSAAAGLTASENLLRMLDGEGGWLPPVRLLLGTPAALLAAAAWGAALGAGGRARGRWFALAWVAATLLRGFYDHIVFDRGPAALLAAAPLLVAMGVAAWIGLREIAPRPASSSRRPSLLSRVPEPPSLGAMRRALRRSDRPVMLGWIGLGALVTVGVVLVSVAVAVWLGHRAGIDFAAAEESDLRSGGPLALLGLAVLAAFPVAGFLIARASGSDSVLEPALAAALAIALVVTLLTLAAPVAVVFALAVAPVAFGLACGGAWFGLGR